MSAAPSPPILRLAELREIEHQSTAPLMERAGAAAAGIASAMLSGASAPPLIVCGPGNNGGDGFVVARLLRQQGFSPVVAFAGAAEKLPPDARAAHAAWLAAGGTCTETIPGQPFALAVDALFGIGLTRPVEGRFAEIIDRTNAMPCPVLALDIPSGLDSETGKVMGSAIRADHTATFIALKPGLLTAAGPDHCGEISVHELGLQPAGSGRTVAPSLFGAHLLPRPRDSHKGSFGSVAIIGGAAGMAGAALLAGRAALKLGAGRVHVGMLERLAVDPSQPELMLRDPHDAIDLATALAVGPGLGQSPAALELLRRIASADFSSRPLVVDADALNLLAAHPVLLKQLTRRTAPTLLTPHPAEAARLLGMATETVQDDRLGHALELARRCNAHVVLKGCGSVIASPDGHWWINTSGNAGLASAGSGDVLSGIVVALLAQGWPVVEALLAATHLHGAAADALAAELGGNVGIAAGELIDAARSIFNRWIAGD
ncbi:MAG: NAD(P)H-hydrate dehydratase [Gammaproteobacteria bacterium]|nr:NAD(P)H-hydrate dehydratase [Gammaproteobacteria bacterium]MBU1646531.1 NAD(P)H-hydrate dehydratase [Gammaproteobacteria bacterium]MBU1973718.1 NAD(P)H-hydrate dehydratase [Gammaproteobacteria bacterium]